MNYQVLIDGVKAVIKQNGNEEITGDLLQQTLLAMISALGVGYQFVGVATPDTVPGTPDARVCYLCVGAGNYANFGTQFVLDGTNIAICRFDTVWTNVLIDIPTKSSVVLIRDLASETGDSEVFAMSQKAITDALNTKVDKVEGKGLSANDFTNEFKAIVEAALTTDDIVGELGESDTKVLSQAAITSILSGYAKTSGHYQQMIVGSAQGMLATSAVEAFFLFQQSGATGNGAALIPTIKGKTIAWNQLVQNGDFSNGTTGWRASGGTLSVSDGVLSWTGGDALYQPKTNFVVGHKYLSILCIKISEDFRLGAGSGVPIDQTATGGSFAIRTAITTATSASQNFYIQTPTPSAVEVKSWMCIDLTLLGLGDPTAEQFRSLYNKLYYSPVSGVLKNNDAVAMITDGSNQWDEVAELGSLNNDGTNYASTASMRTQNFVPIIANMSYCLAYKDVPFASRICFYDINKTFISKVQSEVGQLFTFTTPANAAYIKVAFLSYALTYPTYNHNICINISNPAKNGTYEPYWTRKVNFGLDAIKVKSPNIWDEEWELGSIDPNGQNVNSNIQIRSKNLVPIFPSTQFYFYSGSAVLGRVCYYDANQDFVSVAYPTENTIITTPAGAYFMRFVMGSGSPVVTTYDNDICINVSVAGINGKYFPYGEDGILTYHGLDGAGTAFDFIFKDANGIQKLQKTMLTEVDLGDLGWTKTSVLFRAPLSGSKLSGYFISTDPKMIWRTQSSVSGNPGTYEAYINSNGNLDMYYPLSDYADGAAFKAAMAGVKLIAEAAEPAILELAEPIPDVFLTAHGGTMLIVSPEGATAPSAPFSADIIYPVDPIASSGASLKNLLEALKTATVITSYTMTFNSTTQQYEFTITK